MGILTDFIPRLMHTRSNVLRPGAVSLAVMLLLCSVVQGYAETSSSEYGLKSAFIFNFAKYVEWPDSAFKRKGEFCIASLGRSQLDVDLAALSGKIVQGRKIVFQQVTTPAEAAQCQVLFISRSELPRMESIQESLRDVPLLTIADRDDFCRKGGMLALTNESGKIAFDVNVQEIQRAKLKPNSQLLRLARKIYGRP